MNVKEKDILREIIMAKVSQPSRVPPKNYPYGLSIRDLSDRQMQYMRSTKQKFLGRKRRKNV